jgi:hypothetical protein
VLDKVVRAAYGKERGKKQSLKMGTDLKSVPILPIS